jgi:hypothetical protein
MAGLVRIGCRAAIRLHVPRERRGGRVANKTRRPPPRTADNPGRRHRPVAGDVPVGTIFRDAENLVAAVLDLYRGGAPLWHLGFVNAAMACAKSLEEGHLLFDAYWEERAPLWGKPDLRRASESHWVRVVPPREGLPHPGAEVLPGEPSGTDPLFVWVEGAGRLGRLQRRPSYPVGAGLGGTLPPLHGVVHHRQ